MKTPSKEAIEARNKIRAYFRKDWIVPDDEDDEVLAIIQAAIDEAYKKGLEDGVRAVMLMAKMSKAESRPAQVGTCTCDWSSAGTFVEDLGCPIHHPENYRSCPKCACLVQGNRCENCDVELP